MPPCRRIDLLRNAPIRRNVPCMPAHESAKRPGTHPGADRRDEPGGTPALEESDTDGERTMIDEPPLLTMRRGFRRPPAAVVAGFQGALTGHVADAMNGRGAIAGVRAFVEPREPLVGIAVTSRSAPGDQLGLAASLDLLDEGAFLVAAADGFAETAITGDLLLGMARNLGARGIVTDSAVRDLAGLKAVGLPVFAAGLTPNSSTRTGPGSAGLPVVIGGVRVSPGDIVVADADGVVVVPQDEAEVVLSALTRVKAAEADMEARVAGGLGVPDFVRQIVASERTLEI